MRTRPTSWTILMLGRDRSKQSIMVNSHARQTFNRLEALPPRGATLSVFPSCFLLLLVFVCFLPDIALHNALILEFYIGPCQQGGKTSTNYDAQTGEAENGIECSKHACHQKHH
jgi:hypothetical protein